MTDYNQSDWRELDNDNTGVSPNGVQGGYSPSQVAPILRAMRGAAKRSHVRSNPFYTTTGTATAYVLTFEGAPTGYVKGDRYTFWAHTNNTGAATININGLGAKTIVSQHGSALTASQISGLRPVELVYDGANFVLISNETQDAKFTGTLTLTGSAVISSGNANTQSDFLNLRPTDYGVGKPGFFVQKSANTTTWNLNLWDTASTAGTISFGVTNLQHNGQTIWTAANDGAGSTLDADLLDGQQGTYYLNAANFTGTIADARLPTSMAGKTFTSEITGTTAVFTGNEIEIQGANPRLKLTDTTASAHDYWVYADSNHFYVLTDRGGDGTWETPHPLDLNSATNTAYVFGNEIWNTGNFDPASKLNTSGGTITGTLTVNSTLSSGGVLTSTVGQLTLKTDSDRFIRFQTAASVNRGIIYNETTDNSLRLQLYNTAGTIVRSTEFRESDGRFYVNGYVESAGNIKVGASTYQTDGNVLFTAGMASAFGASLYDALGARITSDGRAYPRRVGGVDINFNWSGQVGQPSWLWGGNDGTNMYVYNPSNFNVNYANSAGNADTVDGYHEWQLAKVYTGSTRDETNLPVGHPVLYAFSGMPDRNAAVAVCLFSSTGGQYVNSNVSGAGAGLGGTWRHRGAYSSGNIGLAQRTS